MEFVSTWHLDTLRNESDDFVKNHLKLTARLYASLRSRRRFVELRREVVNHDLHLVGSLGEFRLRLLVDLGVDVVLLDPPALLGRSFGDFCLLGLGSHGINLSSFFHRHRNHSRFDNTNIPFRS